MSLRDVTRSCPRCERELIGRERSGRGGLTLIWQCLCGWASARTVPLDHVGISREPERFVLGGEPVEDPELDGRLAPRTSARSGVSARPVEARGGREPVVREARAGGGGSGADERASTDRALPGKPGKQDDGDR
jgi:hypothetical protein